MSLHATPELHDADPPEAWRVVKVTDRCWHLVSSLNESAVFEYFTTKRAAEVARTDGWAATLYEKEGRWFRGELIPMWKPYAEVAAERCRRTTLAAGKLGTQHGSGNTAPFGDLDDAGSGDLMTALGETGDTTDENYGYRVGLLDAYREAWEKAAGRYYPIAG